MQAKINKAQANAHSDEENEDAGTRVTCAN